MTKTKKNNNNTRNNKSNNDQKTNTNTDMNAGHITNANSVCDALYKRNGKRMSNITK